MPDQSNGNGAKLAAAAKSPYAPTVITSLAAVIVAAVGWQANQTLSDVRTLLIDNAENRALIDEAIRVNDRQDRKLQSHDSRLYWVEIRLGDNRGAQ